MIKGLIFDLDGCIIDSSEVQKKALYGSYDIVVGDGNYPIYDEYMKYTGDSIDNVLKKMHLPQTMASHFRIISQKSIDKIKVNWELINLIELYQKQGCKIAICTGKDHYRVEEILSYFNIEKSFDCIIGSDDVIEPKPSPESVFIAMQEMEIDDKEEVIFIGDGYNDMLSSKNAGVKFILSSWYMDKNIDVISEYIAEDVKNLDIILNQIMQRL